MFIVLVLAICVFSLTFDVKLWIRTNVCGLFFYNVSITACKGVVTLFQVTMLIKY